MSSYEVDWEQSALNDLTINEAVFNAAVRHQIELPQDVIARTRMLRQSHADLDDGLEPVIEMVLDAEDTGDNAAMFVIDGAVAVYSLVREQLATKGKVPLLLESDKVCDIFVQSLIDKELYEDDEHLYLDESVYALEIENKFLAKYVEMCCQREEYKTNPDAAYAFTAGAIRMIHILNHHAATKDLERYWHNRN